MSKGAPVDSLKSEAGKALEHLDAICTSPSFAPSKRCQEFLRYIVLETVEGRGDQIKERNIAREVFGKGEDFEPGEFSLVRVKAGELRKRLSDYYQSTPGDGIRIELPPGSYVPRICAHPEPAVAAAAAEPRLDPRLEPVVIPPPPPVHRRRFLWLACGTAAAASAAGLYPLLHHKAGPLDELWRPVFATKVPLLIFIPVMREKDGSITEWVGIGPSAALRRAADFLTSHRYPYHLRFGSELTFSQLREQPSLLLGGFEVEWTLRMTHDLRFAPYEDPNTGLRAFIDRQTKQTWEEVKHAPNPYVDVDYGILCRLFDSVSGQIVFLAVGTQTFGTEGAASLLFDPSLFAAVIQRAPANWDTKNFQVVIRVAVIGTTPSPAEIVATHFW
jgi:hypothetical protein